MAKTTVRTAVTAADPPRTDLLSFGSHDGEMGILLGENPACLMSLDEDVNPERRVSDDVIDARLAE